MSIGEFFEGRFDQRLIDPTLQRMRNEIKREYPEDFINAVGLDTIIRIPRAREFLLLRNQIVYLQGNINPNLMQIGPSRFVFNQRNFIFLKVKLLDNEGRERTQLVEVVYEVYKKTKGVFVTIPRILAADGIVYPSGLWTAPDNPRQIHQEAASMVNEDYARLKRLLNGDVIEHVSMPGYKMELI